MKLTISNPVTIHARKSYTVNQCARVFAAAEGRCYLCGEKIGAGEAWHIEHPIALALGGSNDIADLRPAHIGCHAVKTKADVKAIAKAKRREARANGTRRERKPIPGGKLQSAPFYKHPTKKRGFDGKVVAR